MIKRTADCLSYSTLLRVRQFAKVIGELLNDG